MLLNEPDLAITSITPFLDIVNELAQVENHDGGTHVQLQPEIVTYALSLVRFEVDRVVFPD